MKVVTFPRNGVYDRLRRTILEAEATQGCGLTRWAEMTPEEYHTLKAECREGLAGVTDTAQHILTALGYPIKIGNKFTWQLQKELEESGQSTPGEVFHMLRSKEDPRPPR